MGRFNFEYRRKDHICSNEILTLHIWIQNNLKITLIKIMKKIPVKFPQKRGESGNRAYLKVQNNLKITLIKIMKKIPVKFPQKRGESGNRAYLKVQNNQ